MSVRNIGITIALACATVLHAVPARAEARAQLAISQGPYYAGVPVTVQVTADGFEEEPQPDIRALADNAELRFVGVSPNVSRSVRIINGQITQSTLVRFTYAYEFLPSKIGRYRIGPFEVAQNSVSRRTGVADISVEDVPISGDQRIRTVLPTGNLYVGQRVPVTIEWWIAAELQGTLFNQRVRVPLLDLDEAFSVAGVASKSDTGEDLRSSLVLYSAQTASEYPASEETVKEGGKRYIVRRVQLTLVALAPGIYRPDPASVVVDQATRWRRDLFGSRVPTDARKIRASDSAHEIRVLELPRTERPAGFTGAIGEGFSIDVAADRTVVQVGDPVTITISLRGAGNIDAAAPPILIGEHALPADDFSVSRSPTAGVFDGAEKKFDAIIRVQRPSVSEIPPVEYAWFNPSLGRFETARSRPIALSVRNARVVGAGDVVHKEPEATAARRPAAATAPNESADGSQTALERTGSFSLTGADLAIETDLARLGAGGRVRFATSEPLEAALYALGALALAAGWFVRRRPTVAPETAARRTVLRTQARRIAEAGDATEIADALRKMNAAVGGGGGTELDSLLAECDTIAFAPDRASGGVSTELRARAAALADALAANDGSGA